MTFLILAVSDRAFCLGVDAEDDFFVFKLKQQSSIRIGDVLEGDADQGLLSGADTAPQDAGPGHYNTLWNHSLAAAIEALVKLGKPQRIQTRQKIFSTASRDVVRKIGAELFPGQAGARSAPRRRRSEPRSSSGCACEIPQPGKNGAGHAPDWSFRP